MNVSPILHTWFGDAAVGHQVVRDSPVDHIFEDAGEHELKGVPDRWRLYRVVG